MLGLCFVSRHRTSAFLALPLIAALMALSGCGSFYDRFGKDQGSKVYDAVDRIDLKARTSLPVRGGSGTLDGIRLHSDIYNPTPDEAEVAATAADSADPGASFDIDMQGVPVETAARSILGDILKLNYAIDPRVQGNVTLASGRPLPRRDLLASFEQALQMIGAALLPAKDGYRILPSAEALGLGSVASGNAAEPGYGVTILPLAHVSVDAMQKILEGFAAKPGMVRAIPAHNVMLIQGSAADRQAVLDSALAFDQDWMKGQSVGIFPLGNASPEAVIPEMQRILDAGEGGAHAGLVQFQPVARMNGILAITKRPDLMKTVAIWVGRLDRSDNAATTTRVYRVKYGDAKQLASVLNDAFGNGSGASDSYSIDTQKQGGWGQSGLGQSGLGQGGAGQGGFGQGGLASDGRNNGSGLNSSGGASPDPNGAGMMGGTGQGGTGGFFNQNPTIPANGFAGQGSNGGPSGLRGRVRITADPTTNSLLIFADRDMAATIEQVLARLDRPRLQVAIEATIAEVSLNNTLQYGVQYFLKNNAGSIGLNSGKTDPIVSSLPGFNFLIGSGADTNLILSALSNKTNVKVLSTPSLVVLDNQIASLQVGDQVPVATSQATLIGSQASQSQNAFPVANNIDYRNTGVILRVLPRITANGNVTLDIEQEISNVVNNGSEGSLTPTVSQRRVKSSIAVTSGQTVLLAGLISDGEQGTRSGLPLVEKIMYLGDLFSTNQSILNRTELIIFIKPQIIQDALDAQHVAEQIREKMTTAGRAK